MYISISSYTYTYRYIHIHINIYIHTSSTATTTMTHPHIHRGGEALETKESQQHQKQAEPHHSPTTTGGGGTMTHPQGGGGGVGDAAPYISNVYIYNYICMKYGIQCMNQHGVATPSCTEKENRSDSSTVPNLIKLTWSDLAISPSVVLL